MSETNYKPTSAFGRWFDERLPLLTLFNGHLMQYPTPKNLNYWWTFGGILTFSYTNYHRYRISHAQHCAR